MASIKQFFSPALVRRLAGDLGRVHPAFDEGSLVPHPGKHAVDVVVNGTPIRAGAFRVTPTR